jgi:hypothetical protein
MRSIEYVGQLRDALIFWNAQDDEVFAKSQGTHSMRLASIASSSEMH